MSVAFAVFLILMMQVTYEWGFDRFHKHADRLYRLEITHGESGAQACLSRPLIEAFTASSPHIEKGAFLNGFVDKEKMTVELTVSANRFWKSYTPFPLIMQTYSNLPCRGRTPCLGHCGPGIDPAEHGPEILWHLVCFGQGNHRRRLDRPPSAESIRIFRIIRLSGMQVYRKIPDSYGKGGWTQNNFECYVRLDRASSADGLVDNFKRNFHHEQLTWETMDLRLTALPDVYFETDCSFDTQKQKGSYALMRLLSGIALLIVVIAAINFTNFSNAQVPMRVRSINTQKVLGGSVGMIRFSLVLEAVGICLSAYLLALFYVYNLSLTSFADIVVGGLSLKGPASVGCRCRGVCHPDRGGGELLACTIYHFVSASLGAERQLRFVPEGKTAAHGLVCLQFVVSFILIIGALFVNLQNRQMLRMPLGFDKEQVVVVLTPDQTNCRGNRN